MLLRVSYSIYPLLAAMAFVLSCSGKKGDPDTSVILTWGATPSLDASCKVTIPATAKFTEYVSTPKNKANPLSKDKMTTGSFASATYGIDIDSPALDGTPVSLCSETDISATATGISCTINNFPTIETEPPANWYSKRTVHTSWTVNGASPTTKTVKKRDLTLDISAPIALEIPAPVNPPTIDAMVAQGMQPKCSSTGCNPGTRASLAVGNFHTCALMPNKTVSCWGYNSEGQLGNNSTTDSALPVAVEGLTEVVSIAAGASHTCALIKDGTVKCWGNGNSGQLATLNVANSKTPVDITGVSTAVAIVAGKYHNCAITSAGTMQCWGNNFNGQLGDGTTTSQIVPTEVAGLSGVVSAAAGEAHTCAVLADGTAKCWGDNYYGEIGDGTADGGSGQNTQRLTPTAVTGLTGAVSISLGARHSCALTSAGTALCWGLGSSAELGTTLTTATCPSATVDAPTTYCSPTPLVVANLTNVVNVTASGYITCLQTSDNRVRCFGGLMNSGVYFGVSGLQVMDNALLFTTGSSHSCGINKSGEVRCYGNNTYGQLGDGTIKTDTNYENKIFPVLVKQNATEKLQPAYTHCRTYSLSVK